MGRSLVLVVVALLLALPPAAGDEDEDSNCPLDIMLVLDRTGSMSGGPAAAARGGAQAMLAALDPDDDQSGVRNFPPTALDKTLTFDHAASDAAVTADPLPIGSSQAEAMSEAHNDFRTNAQPISRKAMIVISDGVNPDSSGVAAAARADDIEVFSIAIGPGADRAHMQSLASAPLSDYYREAETDAEARAAMADFYAFIIDCGLDVELDLFVECHEQLARITARGTGFKNGTIVRTEWDPDDGGPNITSEPPKTVLVRHYPMGHYNVTLKVENRIGMTNTVHISFEVPPCPPTPPEAEFFCAGLVEPKPTIRLEERTWDRYGDALDLSWDFGDGTTATGPVDRHVFPDGGTYTVRLTVTDTEGFAVVVEHDCRVKVYHPPVIDPIPNQTVYEGQSVRFRVTASDPDDDVLSFRKDDRLPINAYLKGQEFDWRTYRGMAGVYGPVLFTVTDGLFSDSTWTMITVLPAPDPSMPENEDGDGDGAPDGMDNCGHTANQDQQDTNGDGAGDVCTGVVVEASEDGPDQGPQGEDLVDPCAGGWDLHEEERVLLCDVVEDPEGTDLEEDDRTGLSRSGTPPGPGLETKEQDCLLVPFESCGAEVLDKAPRAPAGAGNAAPVTFGLGLASLGLVLVFLAWRRRG